MSADPVDRSTGTWLHPPVRVEEGAAGELVVEPAEGSDLWRHTSYGFVHDDAPALLAPFPAGSAVEVTVRASRAGTR